MSHRFQSSGTPLWHFSANGEPAGFKLLIRVVSVNDDGKLTLPARELWAKIEGDAADSELNFLFNSSNSVDDDQEGANHTIAEAQEAMGAGGPWLRSLEPSFSFTGKWYVTELVKAEICIWEKVDCDAYGAHYKIHEKNLRTWLASGKGGKEVFDDEEDWACLSCPSDDESQEPSSGDGNDDDMSRTLMSSTRMINLRIRITASSLRSLPKKTKPQLKPTMASLRNRSITSRSWMTMISTTTRKMVVSACLRTR